jgi:thymidylate synthase ThyX
MKVQTKGVMKVPSKGTMKNQNEAQVQIKEVRLVIWTMLRHWKPNKNCCKPRHLMS